LQNQLDKIEKATDSIKKVLSEKNRRYGNSALNPINVFSSLNADEGIKQRLDDKLKRIKTHTEKQGMSEPLRKNDVFDLIGYLILYCVNNNWTDFEEFLD